LRALNGCFEQIVVHSENGPKNVVVGDHRMDFQANLEGETLVFAVKLLD